MGFVVIGGAIAVALVVLLLASDDDCNCAWLLNKSLIALRIFLMRLKFNKGFKTPFN